MSIPTINSTPGSATANSFGSRQEADTYHATQLHPDAIWPLNISASATIGSGANGVITVTVDTEGTEGNDYTISCVLAGASNAPMAAALVGTAITVTLGTDALGAADPTKNTALLIAAAINALTGLTASASGTGATVIPVTSSTAFTGGSYIEELKNPALIMATQLMTSLINWTGFYSTNEQALPWPRNSMWYRNDRVYVPNDVIPKEVKYAQFELARLLINSDRTAEQSQVVEGLASLKVGPINLAFRNPSGKGESAPAPLVIPDSVTDLLVASWVDSVNDDVYTNLDLMRA